MGERDKQAIDEGSGRPSNEGGDVMMDTSSETINPLGEVNDSLNNPEVLIRALEGLGDKAYDPKYVFLRCL